MSAPAPLIQADGAPTLRGPAAWPARPPARTGSALLGGLAEPLVGGNRVELLQDGPRTYEAMLAAISVAHHHIHLESYILEADGPGEAFARGLLERARAGVQVNVLFDSFGSLGTPARYFEHLRENGIHVCEANPVARLGNLLSRALHLRDHRKLMVVDGRVAFIGGINISPVYSSGSAPIKHRAAHVADRPGWRDTHVRVEGPAVAHLQRLFLQHWSRHGNGELYGPGYFPPLAPAGPHRVAIAAREAGRRRSPFYRALLGAIGAAQHRILLTTAYLVPTRRLMRALVLAARRGVEVHLLLPGVSDFWAPLAAGRSHYAQLLRAGVHLHERHDTLLHAKTCVVDGLWTTVGSSNLDWRSLVHNAEANVIVLDESLGREMEQVFAADVACARTITREQWRRRGWRQRVLELIAQRFEFFL
jgi:cardiolipin synthase